MSGTVHEGLLIVAFKEGMSVLTQGTLYRKSLLK